MRQRIIFIGVRNDLVERFGAMPAHPQPLGFQYTVRDAIGCMELDTAVKREWLTPRMRKWWEATPTGRSLDYGNQKTEGGTSGMTKTRFSWNKPGATIMQKSNSGTLDSYHPDIPASFSIPELKRICAFPDDFQLTGTYAQQWERLGRAVPPVMMFHIAKTVQEKILDRCK
jgi:DNA (cytosine-5)-methyltransferase 1